VVKVHIYNDPFHISKIALWAEFTVVDSGRQLVRATRRLIPGVPPENQGFVEPRLREAFSLARVAGCFAIVVTRWQTTSKMRSRRTPPARPRPRWTASKLNSIRCPTKRPLPGVQGAVEAERGVTRARPGEYPWLRFRPEASSAYAGLAEAGSGRPRLARTASLAVSA